MIKTFFFLKLCSFTLSTIVCIFVKLQFLYSKKNTFLFCFKNDCANITPFYQKMTLHLRYCDFLFQKQNFFFLLKISTSCHGAFFLERKSTLFTHVRTSCLKNDFFQIKEIDADFNHCHKSLADKKSKDLIQKYFVYSNLDLDFSR